MMTMGLVLSALLLDQVTILLLRLMNKLVGILFCNPPHADTGYAAAAPASNYHPFDAGAYFISM